MSRRHPRGSALMTSVLLISVMLVVTAGVLYFAGQEHQRAIQRSRGIPRNYCVETGLQMARAYFGTQQAVGLWSTYLADTADYNPVPPSGAGCPGARAVPTNDPVGNPVATAQGDALQAAHPELFADLDGDGLRDVYIYMRDDADESPVNDCTRDNNFQVLVGAVCVSQTLAPRREDGTLNPIEQTAEAMMQYTPPSQNYGQRSGGSLGNANANR